MSLFIDYMIVNGQNLPQKDKLFPHPQNRRVIKYKF